MTRKRESDAALLEAAAQEAISAASWERVDLESRRPDAAHIDLILGKAAELAFSPIGRDQLMSVALTKAACNPDAAGPLIDPSVPAEERAAIAERVRRLGTPPASETETLVGEIEERNVRQLGSDARFDLLPQRMRQDAVLHESLWDHPAIPAGDEVRLAMLSSIPKLLERVEALSSDWPRRLAARWLNHFAARGA